MNDRAKFIKEEIHRLLTTDTGDHHDNIIAVIKLQKELIYIEQGLPYEKDDGILIKIKSFLKTLKEGSNDERKS